MSDLLAKTLHAPVLLSQVLRALNPKSQEIYVDGTFGIGGYSKAILETAPCHVYGIDRDPEAHLHSEVLKTQFGERFHFLQGCFGDMEALLQAQGLQFVDGIVLDLGVSSPQLDQPKRGFSFKKEGPLDMRMGSSELTAAEVINTYDEKALADIFFTYGEERQSRKIAHRIVQRRTEKEFQTTQELANLIREAIPFQKKGHDPATRTFQALRIYVNDELGELTKALEASERLLKPEGRLVIVAFHSLEDRAVKQFIKEKSNPSVQGSRHLPLTRKEQEKPTFDLLYKKAIVPQEDEVRLNPRSRSAKLRAARRTSVACKERFHG